MRSLFELGRCTESRLILSKAFRDCGDTKELKLLENEYNQLYSPLILRPKVNSYEVVDDELGDGNFSKVFKVCSKIYNKSEESKQENSNNKKSLQTESEPKVFYAVKVLEKETVEKTRRRHPNVDNEIKMEKKILLRLSGHPNIIQLLSTFQDPYTLYYQMEYIGEGELWSRLHDVLLTHKVSIIDSLFCIHFLLNIN